MNRGFSTGFVVVIVMLFLLVAYLVAANSKKTPLLSTNSSDVKQGEEITQNCGDLPQVVQDFITKAQQTPTILPVQQGPDWSLDCRYIATTIQDQNRNAHLHLYRTQNNRTEEIKAPKGASEYSGINHTNWLPNGCLETEVSVDGVSGQTKIYYNPGQGFAASPQC